MSTWWRGEFHGGTVRTVVAFGWATAVFTMLLAFGAGLENRTLQNMRAVGLNMGVVRPGSPTTDWHGETVTRTAAYFDLHLAKGLASEIRGIIRASPEIYGYSAVVQFDGAVHVTTARGVGADFHRIRNIDFTSGSWFDAAQVARKEKVVVLGETVSRALCERTRCLGHTVEINRAPFRVIGILQEKRSSMMYAGREQNAVFVPYTAMPSVSGAYHLDAIVYQAHPATQPDRLVEEITGYLAASLGFHPSDRGAVSIWDQRIEHVDVHRVLTGLRSFLLLVGLFTAALGGVGIANLMYGTVSSETAEIGVRRAVGARRRQVVGHYLARALVLTAVGSMVGLGLSMAAIQGLRLFPENPDLGHPTLDFGTVATAIFVFGVVGGIAGYLPARRASQLDPVQAIRR